jgi:uncharacterized protein involved in exopolysaccharide biosynthesis
MNELVPGDRERLDGKYLFSVIWDARRFLSVFISIFAGCSILVALWLPDIYVARALLSPKLQGGADGLTRIAGQYGNLAGLAGINLGAASSDGLSKAQLAQEKIKSLAFFSDNLYEEVLIDLMAVGSWNSKTRKIEYNEDIYDAGVGQWVRQVRFPRKAKPSMQEAYQVYRDLLSVSEDPETGLITIEIEHQSPDLAKLWLDSIINKVSEDIRARDIEEAKESIQFLESQRKKTSLLYLDGVFSQLIEEQTKTIMLANVTKDYIFDIIDPPVVPETKAKPSRGFICLLGTLLGAMIATSLVVVRHLLINQE